MTDTYSSSAPRREPLRKFLWILDTPAGLVWMFAAAFIVRILIAPHVGFYIDLHAFQMWAGQLRALGPDEFYASGADYPPGYVYVLWLTGTISATPGYLLLKLPAILGDLGVAWIAGLIAARIAPAAVKERMPVRAVTVAAVLFNPAVIALSTVWGQVDVVPVFFVLSSLLLLFTGKLTFRRELGAFVLFTVAFSMKPQACLAFPVMAYALYRWHLHGRPRAEWIKGALSIVGLGAVSIGLWAISGLPFGLGPVSLVQFYNRSASLLSVTSANAFNLWGALGFWRNDSTGDDVLTVAGIPALYVGSLAFLAGTTLVLVQVHRAINRGSDQARVLMAAAAVLSLLGYAVLTRMHERYMFIALACFAPFVFARRFRIVYVALSVLFILNLWYPYAGYNEQRNVEGFLFQPFYDWLYGGFASDAWQKKVLSLAVLAIALTAVWRGVRWPVDLRLEESSSLAAVAPVPTWTEPGPSAPFMDVVRGLRGPAAGTRAESPVLARWAPIALVGLTCVFCLVILRGETKYAQNLNDSSFHLEMVRWADDQIGEGRVPLDGWFPYLSLGSSQFHHYQSLPHTLTAYVARIGGASDESAYLWIQYLLIALWPIAVFWGARLMGWSGWTAACAAAVSPLVVSASGYGYEHGSYTWQGYGVYSQLWGMWLLPITWGLTWRAVTQGRYYAGAAAALAFTIACHFITGYLAILTVGVWVLVLGRTDFVRRVGRAALVVVGSTLIAAWVLVPLVTDTKWTNQSTFYQGGIFNDSYGARTVLGWLFRGDLFDNGRFPIITILFFVGVAYCLVQFRADIRARAVLGAFVLSLLLFFGRPTLGPVLDLLPGMKDVQIHRFVMGVHLAGILLAGVGLGFILRTAFDVLRRVAGERWVWVAGAAVVVAAVAALAPAWTERARYDERGDDFIRTQQVVDASDGRDFDSLIAIVKASADGRTYGGLRANWGAQYRVGVVPVHAALLNREVDAIGFVFRTIASLSTDVEAGFIETNPADYEMFNIRYLILPSDRQPSVPATLLGSSGRHRLWKVKTSGFFQVVDRAAAISADRTNVLANTGEFMKSGLASRGIYPGIAFAGGAAPPPTFIGPNPPAGAPGRVLKQAQTLQDGLATATVEANRRAVVLLKATYDRRWTATVDGVAVKPVMMAPSLVGVEVSPGTHNVEFRYKPVGYYPIVLAIGALTLLGLALIPRRESLLRFARSRSQG